MILHLQNSAFFALDEQFYSAVQSKQATASGSTLLAVVLCGPQLLVANAGDSRAVLCRRGRAYNLSEDHKPTTLWERERITVKGALLATTPLLARTRRASSAPAGCLQGVSCARRAS